MIIFRIALANIRFPATAEESITLAAQAIGDTGRAEFFSFSVFHFPRSRADGPPKEGRCRYSFALAVLFGRKH